MSFYINRWRHRYSRANSQKVIRMKVNMMNCHVTCIVLRDFNLEDYNITIRYIFKKKDLYNKKFNNKREHNLHDKKIKNKKNKNLHIKDFKN